MMVKVHSSLCMKYSRWVIYSVMGGVYVIWEIDNTDLCGFKE